MNKGEFKNRLVKYLEVEGISRYESNIAKMMEAEINKNNCFTVSYDNFGSIIFHKKIKVSKCTQIYGSKAHMDEVGFLVKGIHENGQIKLSSVGGLWPKVLL